MTSNILDKYRQITDPVADEVVKDLFDLGYNPLRDEDYGLLEYNRDKIPDSFPSSLKNYFSQLIKSEVPEKLKAGQRFFDQNANPILTILGFLSLPYCYAGEKGVQVLYLSERIRKDPETRLLETGEFVFDVCSKEAFTQKGKGFISIGKVRLMHAAVRYHINKSGKWNHEWDEPINQEDMAGTNLAFSVITIRGMRKLGYQVSPEEANSYIEYWNYIGKLLGVEDDLLPKDNLEAFQLDKLIATRNFRSCKEGKELTQSLLNYYKGQKDYPIPIDPEVLMTFLLGKNVSETLGLNYSETSSIFIKSFKGINTIQNLFTQEGQWHKTKRLFNQQKVQNDDIKPFRLVKGLKG